MSESKIKILISTAVAFVTVLIISLFIGVCFQLVKISSLKKEETLKQQKLEELTLRNTDIEELKKYFDENKTFVSEEYVREVLGWGKDGETVFKRK